MRVSEGDLRKAITYLQSAARLNNDRDVTEHAVVEIAGVRRGSRRHVGHVGLPVTSPLCCPTGCSSQDDRQTAAGLLQRNV